MATARPAGNGSLPAPGRPLLRNGFATRQMLLVLLAGCLAGCGSWFGPPPIPPYSVLPPKQYALEELPVGEYLGSTLDEGRLRIATPKDWYYAPRGRDRLVEFHRNSLRQPWLPRIWVSVERSPYEGISTVDGTNVERFAELVAQRLKQDDKIEALHEPAIRPLQIGPTFGARYVYLTHFVPRGEEKGQVAERQVVEVLVDDRLYRVELHVPMGKMLEYRDLGYAVVASMEFPRAGQTESAPGNTEPAPKDTATPAAGADSSAGLPGAGGGAESGGAAE